MISLFELNFSQSGTDGLTSANFLSAAAILLSSLATISTAMISRNIQKFLSLSLQLTNRRDSIANAASKISAILKVPKSDTPNVDAKLTQYFSIIRFQSPKDQIEKIDSFRETVLSATDFDESMLPRFQTLITTLLTTLVLQE